MAQRKILVLEPDQNWQQYLREAFEDTRSIPEFFKDPKEFGAHLRKIRPDVVFADPRLLSPALVAALRAHRVSNPDLRNFALGEGGTGLGDGLFAASFTEIPLLGIFQRQMTVHLPLPDPLRLLVVDDDPEIRNLFKEYFSAQIRPAFQIETACDGVEGEKKIRAALPDVLVMDIKMPNKDGRELYLELYRAQRLPPAIIFFDIISADEVIEIRRIGGHPAFVEKGARSSEMREMESLIKKVAFFG